MANHSIKDFPGSRIATIDVCEFGMKKHHVAALLEIDVTKSRKKIREYKRNKGKISFSAWLVKAITAAVHSHKRSASFLWGKRKVIVFDDVNVSFLVEKELNGEKVPFPILLKKLNEATMEDITQRLRESKMSKMDGKEIVLQRKSTKLERFYYRMPGFMRRLSWKIMLSRPHTVFSKMGNVAVTSIGMVGKMNGWFIPISIHPICFGVGSLSKKPVVVDDNIEIREIMNLTVLIDHDVIDGAPMARFISELSKNIEGGIFL